MYDSMHSYTSSNILLSSFFFQKLMFADHIWHVILMFLIKLKFRINLPVFLQNVFLKSKPSNNNNNTS